MCQPTSDKSGSMCITKIEKEGNEVPSVDIRIVPPGEKNFESRSIKSGDSLSEGTEIIAPARTAITLKSSNGNEISLDPGCRLVIGTVNPDGESYRTEAGRAWFYVMNSLSFFRVEYQGRFVALVKGTQFSVDMQPRKLIRFEAESGNLNIVRTGAIRIEEGNKEVAEHPYPVRGCDYPPRIHSQYSGDCLVRVFCRN